MERDVFISHSSVDHDKAKAIQGHLQQEGHACWLAPDDVRSDGSWAEQIVTAINTSKVLLIVLSSSANHSLNVSREVALAADKIPLLTARIEDVRPGGALQYFLTLIQWIDVFPEPVAPHLTKVKSAVGLLLSDETARSQAASVSRTLPGHTGAVTSLAFSPDGQYLASGSSDGTIRLWDVRSRREIAVLTSGRCPVNAVSISPGGSRIVSAAGDGVHVWDAHSARELATLKGHAGSVNACAFSPDGQVIASASDDATLRLWDAETGFELSTIVGHVGAVNSCAFSPDGRLVVSGGHDASAKLWDTRRGEMMRTVAAHAASINSCSFSPDGRVMMTTSSDRTSSLYDVATGQVLRSLRGHLAPVTACDFSPDGELILSAGSDGLLKLWNREGEELASYTGQTTSIRAAAFSPDGRVIASAGAGPVISILGEP